MLPDGWFTALQSLGIIGSFSIAAYTAFTANRARKVANYIELMKSHRDVWKLQWLDDDLKDLLSHVHPSSRALTAKEKRFLGFLFLHITAAYELSRTNNIVRIEEIGMDVRQLLATPLARRFWEENKRFYNDGFIQFVEAVIPPTRKP